jgi:hypothetical protein
LIEELANLVTGYLLGSDAHSRARSTRKKERIGRRTG